MPSDDSPPYFEPGSAAQSMSTTSSKIINVSLYSGRAEITREFRLTVKTGHNQVEVLGLPNAMDQDSLRVEGRGSATIHDVTVTNAPRSSTTFTSPTIEALQRKEQEVFQTLDSARQSRDFLSTYLSNRNNHPIALDELETIIERYAAMTSNLDNKILDLRNERKALEEEITEARKALQASKPHARLGLQASIGIFAKTEGRIKILLIYAVNEANWSASYDIRVNTETKENPFTLVYKASIAQSTAEAWDDVPLTLETASPTFDVVLPTLWPWNLIVHDPTVQQPQFIPASYASQAPIMMAQMIPSGSRSHRRSRSSRSRSRSRSRSPRHMRVPEEDIEHRVFDVSSKGNVNATFRVPGKISIPSDGKKHNVTIAQLELNAPMQWVCVPKMDVRVHLTAKVKNESDYTLISGPANVYVDGSFISKTNIPLVTPQETFDCPLGLDPSIRITYHPSAKKASQSGFYQKTAEHTFIQRITVHNAKQAAVNVKILDQVPVSQDARVEVKLVNPALTVPEPPSAGSIKGISNNLKRRTSVSPAKGVMAQWEGAEDAADESALGRDGKLSWLCTVPAKGTTDVMLQWEVGYPKKLIVRNL
ncbi:mucoidy inhibitor A [Crucibulum laeve]|uniref:Mucoidy inhibitor A n=1 Tax=Crucibulum laeve TaxID=68775 RepID=A0A5C3M2J7_9AGAR|nr:mucoidy inhibitor A [Crucibulum laeve]